MDLAGKGRSMLRPYKELRSEQALKGAARETEKMVEQEGGKRDECNNDYGCGNGMGCRHPGQPNGQDIFSETQCPIAQWLGAGIDGGARAGFRAVCGEGNSAGAQRSAPAPFR